MIKHFHSCLVCSMRDGKVSKASLINLFLDFLGLSINDVARLKNKVELRDVKIIKISFFLKIGGKIVRIPDTSFKNTPIITSKPNKKKEFSAFHLTRARNLFYKCLQMIQWTVIQSGNTMKLLSG